MKLPFSITYKLEKTSKLSVDMDSYRRITQGVASDLNNSFGRHLQSFRKLDPNTFREIQRQEEQQHRMALAQQVHTLRAAATERNVDRVNAKRASVKATHNERIKKKIQTAEERPQLEKRKPGRPKKLPPVASGPPVHTASPSPS
jgi:hypothetical protein